MSGVQVDKRESWEQGGHFGTSDVQFACTLSSLGFELRGKMPIMLQYDGNVIARAHITNDFGNLTKVADCYCVFSYECVHASLGRMTCPQIERAYKLAQLKQERERGDISASLQARIDTATEWCKAGGVSDSLAILVQFLLDQLCNWNVYCETISSLAGDPFIKFSKDLRRGVQHAVNPLNTEKATVNRAEKFFRE